MQFDAQSVKAGFLAGQKSAAARITAETEALRAEAAALREQLQIAHPELALLREWRNATRDRIEAAREVVYRRHLLLEAWDAGFNPMTDMLH
jgi:uncharacterized coiled-coil DUF342 family protein